MQFTEVQAEPLETAMFLRAMSSDSPSTYAKLKFKQPGYLAHVRPSKYAQNR